MKKLGMAFLVLMLTLKLQPKVYAQDTTIHRPVVYTVMVNVVPDHFDFPLIGFVNIVNGSHKGVQVGFLNLNQKDFKGFQTAFVNHVGGNMNGAQIGFVSSCLGNSKGLQVSYVNIVGRNLKGSQIGFVNTTVGSVKGFQIGFVNTAGEIKGSQIGFVNTIARQMKGPQIGFVNIAKEIKGIQLGFVNIADSIDGTPVGFLSIVKKGGYQALELGVSEMYPANLSFKIGVKKLYTSFVASWNPNLKKEFAAGAGLGSILPLFGSFFFNPEVVGESVLVNDEHNDQQSVSLTTNLGVSLSKRFQLLMGPSVVWNHADNPEYLNNPLFSIYKDNINSKNNLIVGLRIAARYCFSK